MNHKEVEAFKAKIQNEGILAIINNATIDTLGVEVDFVPFLRESRTHEWSIMLVDQKSKVSSQLRTTPLLRYIFKEASLDAKMFYNEELKELQVTVDIHYTHPGGAGNGRTLFNMSIDIENKEVIEIF